MRRIASFVLIVGCFLGLLLTCYGSALFQNRQFGYRDAAHFYYPLYQRVEQEWKAGRWPLWEPEENCGMPLLGNPTAAVFYPGKLIYTLAPSYAWGARLYIVAHTALAFGAMLLLMRTWGVSRVGSGLSALAYAFGAPILFQYCNIIFLVGAAWLPLGFRAVDGWLRLGRLRSLAELAVVLAMQALGGDPQAAYLTGVCAGGYAIGLAWVRACLRRPTARQLGLGLAIAAIAWLGAVLGLAALSLIGPPPGPPARVAPGPAVIPAALNGALGLIGLVLLYRWGRPRGRQMTLIGSLAMIGWLTMAAALTWGVVGGASPAQAIVLEAWALAGLALFVRKRGTQARTGLPRMLVGLAVAGGLSAALAAVQLLPVLEFSALSLRASEVSESSIDPFSLEPHRVVEFLWPNFFGTHRHENRTWLTMVPPVHAVHVWVPSLYVGGLTLVLALGAAGFRGGPPWRSWLTAVALFGLIASLGQFGSPLWWARNIPACARVVGPLDPSERQPERVDGAPRDGFGSPYWMMTAALPGFRQFRYPAKLMTLTCLALSALAGHGWDRLVAGRGRRSAITAAGLLALTMVALVGISIGRGRIVATFAADVGQARTMFGPLSPAGAFADLRFGLVQGAVALAAALGLAILAGRRPRFAGALATIVLAVDLAVANAGLVFTVPQAILDQEPKVIGLIDQAERDRPSTGPYRIHRMPVWSPMSWLDERSRDRVEDFVRWEHDTIQPKYAIPYGTCYTLTLGTTELFDLHWFFSPFLRQIHKPEVARWLGVAPEQSVVYYPRRGFDLWNTRYFVVPAGNNHWRDDERGYAAFLPRTDAIYPKPHAFEGPDRADRLRRWAEREDFQIFRNQDAFPRAWVVHQARQVDPIVGLAREDRRALMEEIVFKKDEIWSDSDRPLYDPRAECWVEAIDHSPLGPYVSGGAADATETATITNAPPGHYPPQEVKLTARLKRPGLVILADVYYPGWRLTIDGRPARIWKVNLLMRGAAVEAGEHKLVYTYEPDSFRIGGGISIAGVLALAGLWWWGRRPAGPLPSGTRSVE